MSNPPERMLTTAAVGLLVGYSAQQVRDLERLGVIPRAQRAPNGYRGYHERHVTALRAYRAVAAAIGPVAARRILPVVVTGTVEDAAEAVDDLHAAIARDRADVRGALRALVSVLADPTDESDERDVMTIGELADALGLRPSALRHWEDHGLVRPARAGAARRYRARAIAEARVVAVLRAGGYGIPHISRVLDQWRTHGLTAEARDLLDARLSDLTRRSIRLLEGAGHLHALLDARQVEPARQ
ncbi:MerR family transcriptional regulator [Microbacterium sp. HD4P20]|uniref:MerR family transcriptional regulator n=1 Tax=Microbacterium sp. HD4P20 TaxID=2864874 RepID=UPI0020A3ED27|nr:MerR family transcriptional regulator [Microbacterium sp. HD4P20]MCP2637851.1 MerR family transcriptional regulator [Microbacterium sp. HD4P20]